MKLNLYKRISAFLWNALLGGVVALLPLVLVFMVVRWIVSTIETSLGPIVELFDVSSQWAVFIVYVLIVLGILIFFFFIGLVIQTRVGRFINHVLEKKYLMKIPGYKIVKETVTQFFGKKQSFFKEVVLVDVFNCGTLMTGFVTDRYENYTTVFVPTGPNPTSGNIYHVPNDKVIPTNIQTESGMKTIISCGAGSSDVFKSSEEIKEIGEGVKN